MMKQEVNVASQDDQALVNEAAAHLHPSGIDPSRWRPITEAPQDGRIILCWWNGLPFPVRWSRGPDKMNLYGWRIASWEAFDFLYFADPQWWMPVMDGPSDSDGSGEAGETSGSTEGDSAGLQGIAKSSLPTPKEQSNEQ